MAIDHTRDYVHSAAMVFPPEDLSRTTPAIFFTRWITHFCAPVFMFCAGLGAFLRLDRGGTRSDLLRFLWTRGVWLILLEITVVRLGFFFNVKYDVIFLLVFWAIGVSLVALAVLVRLPYKALLAASIGLIALHNTLDGVRAADLGSFAWVWNVLHQPGLLWAGPPTVVLGYPVIPWIGVMALGYCAGRLYRLPSEQRRRWLFRLGLGLTVAFVAIRALNVYGDPRPWAAQATPMLTVISFLNCTKYPPSLTFLLMTLGPALIFLGWADRVRPERHPLIVFGRVPLFFFVVHLPVIHAVAIAMTAARYGAAPFLWTPPPTLGTPLDVFPAGYGWGLWAVYGVWLLVATSLYPVCRWFAALKSRRREWWISYL